MPVDEGARAFTSNGYQPQAGCSRTRDDVIRREVRLVEGDAFNKVLLSRSERNCAWAELISAASRVAKTPGT